MQNLKSSSPFSVLRSPFSVLRSPFSVLRSPLAIAKPLIITVLILVFIACEPEPVCNLGAHLGIGETCNGTSCTLQDYRTENAKNFSHADYFPVPINRVGAESNFTSGTLTSAAGNVISAHNGLSTTDKNNIKDGVPAGKLSAVHIYNNLGSYKWNGNILGIKINETIIMIDTYLGAIASGSMPLAQILSMSNGVLIADLSVSDTDLGLSAWLRE